MEVTVDVPFPTEREAKIALNTLSVDPEPKRSQLVKKMTIRDGAVLEVTFKCDNPTTMRVSVGSFFELLTLTLKTIQRFDVVKK